MNNVDPIFEPILNAMCPPAPPQRINTRCQPVTIRCTQCDEGTMEDAEELTTEGPNGIGIKVLRKAGIVCDSCAHFIPNDR